ncbi:hypothetical protein KPL35_10520 [Clostridium sp. CF011]|uniref:DUF7922 domain-containing protein n=1 Tax=Clostridium sp. CF011 TaxID=2843318 RepID=UPI001C0C9D4F|nr:hypothetical protein [Clostridium sp. CF011]MBU3092510.1 hypothetical protein [Clostridium sp. CF011]WAG68800.1 hypothetical protein LL036_11925 [Clostridium sp. CF011]
MTPKKNYSRYFIILQEDEKGYSLEADKIPSGYAKLEMKNSKCKVSYYVQNLRKEKQPYYMILICGKKDVNKIIKVGKLNIDDHGRVDISHEYDMDNIADTGISAEKIIGAAIVKFLDVNVISIMSGFSTTDKPNEWKNYKLADCNKDKKETRADDISNEFDEYEQSIELIKVKNADVVEHLEAQEKVDGAADTKVDTKKRGNAEDIGPLDAQDKVADEVVEHLETHEKVDEAADTKVDTKKRGNIEELGSLEAQDKVADEVVEHLETHEKVDEAADTKVETMKRGNTEDLGPLEAQDKVDKVDKVDTTQRINIEDVEISDKLKGKNEVKKLEDDFDVNRDKDKKQHKEDKKDECNYKEKKSSKEEYPKGAMGEFFKAVAQDFDEVPDFSNEIKWCKWYKVPVSNLENMYDLSDYNKYTIAYYPMISYYPYIRNYKSFMLGYKCDSSGKMKYIVYGIPGSRAKTHQPYGGKTGFVSWISDKENDEMGYWLMFYDFKNSTIVVPLKK